MGNAMGRQQGSPGRAVQGAGNGIGGLGAAPGLRHGTGMSRIAIAVPLGLLGFALYVGVVVALGDLVLGRHWALEMLYFLFAGIAWAFPARWLMMWAAGKR